MTSQFSVDEEFDYLTEALLGAPVPSDSHRFQLDVHARLASCLRDVIVRTNSGPGDLGALIAATLKRSAKVGGPSDLVVPLDRDGWPTRNEWLTFGLDATPLAGSRLRLRPVDWTPDWLPDQHGKEFAADLFDSERTWRRLESEVPADPTFIEALGTRFGRYVSPGQRQASRSVITADPGATLLVSLPTGGGKTEVALVEALRPPDRATAVVIVPTVGLAMDQERRIRELLVAKGERDAAQRPFAYIGDASAGNRGEMRSRVRSGEQRVIFVSPEAACGSLAPALFDAASNDGLRLFAVDEAHLIAAWGGEFRPDFQQIAGLRSALLRASTSAGFQAFKTLLLSATIPQLTLDLLERLFGEPGPFVTVSATALRAEPSYWIAHCATEDERRSRYLEAIAHLPRPLITYVATREHAVAWANLLNDAGYRAVRTFTGDTPGRDRREVLGALRGPWTDDQKRADIVVATTAFGVGVDQPNIRAVVHLCVPESLDRFYQEVGRGGRDGHPSVSLMLWCESDLEIAKSLAIDRLITPDKGFERWRSLQASAVDLGDGRRRIDLNARPEHLVHTSKANRLWNMRTLGLMAQAELIRLDAERPADSREFSTDDDDLAGESVSLQSTVVLLRRGDIASENTWQSGFAPVRDELMSAKLSALGAMRHALRPGEAICTALQGSYTLRAPGGERLVPAPSCGGCPGCRPRKAFVAVAPEPPPLDQPRTALGPDLDRLFAGGSHLFVVTNAAPTDASRDARQSLGMIVRACLRQGIEVILADDETLSYLALNQLMAFTVRGILLVQSQVRRLGLVPHLPALFIDSTKSRHLANVLLSDERPTSRYVFVVQSSDLEEPGVAQTRIAQDQPRYSAAAFLDAV